MHAQAPVSGPRGIRMRCHGGMKAEQDVSRAEPQLVPGAHRVVRRLSAEEGPYPGTLVTRGDGVAVLRDADEIDGWEGRRHAGSRHVVGPLDLVRRVDGHDVLLPWCTERVSTFIGQRGSGEPALSAGEVGTLAVSLLRGIDESTASGTLGSRGEWWLTDEGCPTFVIGAEDGRDARTSAADLVEALEAGRTDRAHRRLLAAIRDGLRGSLERPDVPRRQLLAWEAELLEIAAPRPLRRVERGAEVRESQVVQGVRGPASPEAERGSAVRQRFRTDGRRRLHGSPRGRRASAVSRLGSLVRRPPAWVSEIGRRFGRWMTQARRMPPTAAGRSVRVDGAAPSRSRRAPKIVVGIGAAALILVGGALWPGGATGEPSHGRPGETATDSPPDRAVPETPGDKPSSPAPEASRRAAESAEGPLDDDPVAAAAQLVRSIGECASSGDSECASSVAPGSAGAVEALSTGDRRGGEAEFALLDVYGDIAVIRMAEPVVEGRDAVGSRVLTLVRVAEKWLVRDVYDAADQPE